MVATRARKSVLRLTTATSSSAESAAETSCASASAGKFEPSRFILRRRRQTASARYSASDRRNYRHSFQTPPRPVSSHVCISVSRSVTVSPTETRSASARPRLMMHAPSCGIGHRFARPSYAGRCSPSTLPDSGQTTFVVLVCPFAAGVEALFRREAALGQILRIGLAERLPFFLRHAREQRSRSHHSG